MKKNIIILLFYMFIANISNSQIVTFDFNKTPFLGVSKKDSNITVSNLLLSAGTINDSVTSGTYFTDEPYVEESGGWSANVVNDAKYFFIDISAADGCSFSVYSIKFDAYSTSAGPSAVSVLINDSVVVTVDMKSGSLQKIDINSLNFNDLKKVRLKIAGWSNGSRETSGGGILKLDNLVVDGAVYKVNKNDANSSVSLIQWEQNKISSTATSPYLKSILGIVIVDSASVDTLNTYVDSLVFEVECAGLNIADVLSSAKLVMPVNNDTVLGVITDSLLTFGGLDWRIKQGLQNADTAFLLVNLKQSLPNGIDNKEIKFTLDNNSVFCNSNGSSVGNGRGEHLVAVSVDATNLIARFVDENVWQDSLFNIIVEAVDSNGNIDIDSDFVVDIELMEGCGKLVEDGSVYTLKNGVCKIDNIKYTASDTVVFAVYSDDNYDTTTICIPVSRCLFYDNFNDSSLAKWCNIMDWSVQNQDSIYDNYVLKHKVQTSGGVSYISSKYKQIDINSGKTVWSINLSNGDFDPTSTNKFWYYIMASDSNLISDDNFGYAVGVNLYGSSDTLSLWRIDSGKSKTEILKTDFDWDKNKNVDIEVIRESQGQWQLGYKCKNSEDNFIYTNKHKDDSYKEFYHGLVFQYTTTRSGQLQSNYISIGILDTPPKILNVNTVSDTVLEIVFTEDVSILDMLNREHYSLFSYIDRGRIDIDSVYLSSNDNNKIILETGNMNSIDYQLYITGSQLDNNCEIWRDSTIFTCVLSAEEHSIVFNEIMFDYYPAVDLPEADYIELFNRSNRRINLKDWQIDIGGIKKIFPDRYIEAGEYIIVTSKSNIDNFVDYGNTIGIISTSALTNTGKILKLYSEKSLLIDSVHYNKNWINDEDKQQGGWSLERIDPNNFCGTVSNWSVSTSETGGTPGFENSVKKDNIDLVSPKVDEVFWVSDNTVDILFSELIRVDSYSDKIYLDETVSREIMFTDSIKTTKIRCVFDTVFVSQCKYKLSIGGFADYCGNIIDDTIIYLQYYRAKFYDVVINEIMATPIINSDLQNYEYVELYNRTNVKLQMADWTIKIGNQTKKISNVSVNPYSYIVLCDADAYDDLGADINKCLIPDMQNLPKSGTIIINDNNGVFICKTDYSAFWIDDEFKAEGGYSMERIDYNNPNETQQNWKVCSDEKGGTPGRLNSVYSINADDIPPELLYAFPLNDTTIGIQFSEPLDAKYKISEVFDVSNNIVKSVFGNDNNLDIFYLILDYKMDKGVEYIVEVSDSVTDICGNYITNRLARVKLPIKASHNDIVINEVLFNSYDDGIDYIELYNRSAFVIDLKQLILASFDDNGNIKSPQKITDNGFLIFPSEYVVLSEDKQKVKSKYWIENNFAFLDMNKFISLPNKDGSVVVLDTSGVVIDYMYYSDDMHFKLLRSTKGVSLERIDYNISAQDKSNWHSASEVSGWGTPGYENSMFNNLASKKDDLIKIEPKAFSPNSDGINDVMYIHYNFKESGIVANISIFDIKGRLVKILVNNQLLSKNGVLSWDGLDENNRRLSVGIYIVYFELFDLEGNIYKYRKACAIND